MVSRGQTGPYHAQGTAGGRACQQLFCDEGSEFVAMPAEKWVKFRPHYQVENALTLEEAENLMSNRTKAASKITQKLKKRTWTLPMLHLLMKSLSVDHTAFICLWCSERRPKGGGREAHADGCGQ
eukprot:scaffold284673_cov41-Prasinocladus_malaysianus.AAC.1